MAIDPQSGASPSTDPSTVTTLNTFGIPVPKPVNVEFQVYTDNTNGLVSIERDNSASTTTTASVPELKIYKWDPTGRSIAEGLLFKDVTTTNLVQIQKNAQPIKVTVSVDAGSENNALSEAERVVKEHAGEAKRLSHVSGDGENDVTGPLATQNNLYKALKASYNAAKIQKTRRNFYLKRDSSGRMYCYEETQNAKPLFEIHWNYLAQNKNKKQKFKLEAEDVDNNIDDSEFDIASTTFTLDVSTDKLKDQIKEHVLKSQPTIEEVDGANGKPTYNVTKFVPLASTASTAAPVVVAGTEEKLDDFLFHAARNIALKKFMTIQQQEEEQRKNRAHIDSLRHSTWNRRIKALMMGFGATDGMYFSGLMGGISEAEKSVMSHSLALFSVAFASKGLEFLLRIFDTITSKNINIGKIKNLIIPILELVAMGVAIYGGSTLLAHVTITYLPLHIFGAAASPFIFAGLLGFFSLYNFGMAIWKMKKAGDKTKYSKTERERFEREAGVHLQNGITLGVLTAALSALMIFAPAMPGTIAIGSLAVPCLPLMIVVVGLFAVRNLYNTIQLGRQYFAVDENKDPKKKAELGQAFGMSVGKTIMYSLLIGGLVALAVFGGPLGAAAVCGIGAALALGVPIFVELPTIIKAIKQAFFPTIRAPEVAGDYELEVRHDYRKDKLENELESKLSQDARDMRNNRTLAKDPKQGWDYDKHADIESTALTAKYAKLAFDNLKNDIGTHAAVQDRVTYTGTSLFWNVTADKKGSLAYLQGFQKEFFNIVNNTKTAQRGGVTKFEIEMKFNNPKNGNAEESVTFYYTDVKDLTEQVERDVLSRFPRAYQSTLQFVGAVQSHFRQANDVLLTMNKVKELDPQGLEDEFKIRPAQIAALGAV